MAAILQLSFPRDLQGAGKGSVIFWTFMLKMSVDVRPVAQNLFLST